MQRIRAYPGDLLIAIHPIGTQTAWFISRFQGWLLLVSAIDGSFHEEVASLAVRDTEELGIHLSRIFEGFTVRIVKPGSARINITINSPAVGAT